ncbi:hypothetical protein D0T87_17690 [Bacteroides sp. 51]|nr:hypothetical protein [Bacteroides sp. 51]
MRTALLFVKSTQIVIHTYTPHFPLAKALCRQLKLKFLCTIEDLFKAQNMHLLLVFEIWYLLSAFFKHNNKKLCDTKKGALLKASDI